ncbi:MAG: FKBP-type peptidyl-prolyl cis-trans isomerase [Phycisphaeraceae bacterium]
MPRRFTVTIVVAAVIAGTVLTWTSFAQPGAGQSNAGQTGEPVELPATDELSYALGYRIGTSFKQDEVEVDVQQFTQGMAAALDAETESRVSEAEMQQTLMQFQQHIQQKQMEQMADLQAQGEEQADAGAAFLEANAEKEGVQQTDSGLQYQVIESGSGASPGPNDRVVVHYTGTLIDGTKFDSSRDRGEPLEFGVGGVIPGWTEGLQLMKEGARYKLFVPSDLAYGERGAGQQIPPNATLIFDVELIEVKSEATDDSAGGGAE